MKIALIGVGTLLIIDGRSIVEAYTKRRLPHDLVIRHPQPGGVESPEQILLALILAEARLFGDHLALIHIPSNGFHNFRS